jgi:intraflagellar transport protein 46
MDEFPCGFSNENFDKDILSPTMSEKHKTSYDDITSSLKLPINSFELAKEEIFIEKELKNLYAYIRQFKPRDINIRTNLKPFYPDYIQALGSVDEFIKVSRPDGQFNNLGLKVLDEDGTKQSDPTILTLQIYSTSIQSNFQTLKVASIENVEKNPKKLDAWINSIKDLHRSKPLPSVLFSKSMPDVDKLKQIWPIQLEKILNEIELPSAKLEVDLSTFIDIYCSIFDIPMYENKVEALHVLFTLYLDLKNQIHQTPLSTFWLNS